ncbi:serine/threonine-protein kinase TTK/MPS1 [Geosmithia morbida]|uniref:Serine/threonine-protein kinase TTK/MPS1 n=1 Tax=Geosmithia morbida TaxID=1094350 RepID=A0A9P4YVB9_9HYPO|nr:serine/threonine-protein kinase TTK/MPS1 [Geosmithia morbida]KAF4122482.1 serine/threonine-protein kinase TTK/MPS1 [Geosmithia morbida]
MASASPTPAPAATTRRTSQRQAVRRPTSRQAMNRSDVQAAQDQQQQYHHNDESSEDEFPVPMKLSALTKALLNDGESVRPVQSRPSPPRTRRQAHAALNSSTSSATENRRYLRSGSAQATDVPKQQSQQQSQQQPQPQQQLPTPPTTSTHSSTTSGNNNNDNSNNNSHDDSEHKEPTPPRKRVVRLSNTPQSLSQLGASKRRSASSSLSAQRSSAAAAAAQPPPRPTSRTGNNGERSTEDGNKSHDYYQVDVNTPAQNERIVRIAAGSSGHHSRVGSSARRSFDRSAVDVDEAPDDDEDPDAVARNAPPVSTGSVANNLQGSIRVKRVGKIPGSFLSGPARRGGRRTQSGEHNDADAFLQGQEPGSHPGRDVAGTSPSYYADGVHDRDFNSGSPVSAGAAVRASQRLRGASADIPGGEDEAPAPRRSSPRIEARIVSEPEQPLASAPAPQMPSAYDQENEAPASYRRANKPPAAEAVPEKASSKPIPLQQQQQQHGPSTVSPARKPLSMVERNTPRRPAPPPPPKMSVIEAATSNAGASTTTQAKQRRNVLKVNGRCYTRLDCLGRGGSAKVYRVTAENGKMFALKRVSLENADESTVRGYRGEIDLLGKLKGVDRVINLFDYEMNDEKRVLSLLMEMGELDLNTLLRTRQNPEGAKLDTVFVRYYWKEMLEALQSVHQYDIVHSDLKPANFVLVQGRLKLIDFGIANAIQTDETVNVHRETQIGTPNYMSPESLMDANTPRGGGRVPGRPKLMKLGKPSDVWSLGCILYQMVYGLPPFGHIANQMARCQAIINWDHGIEFPSRGVGGVAVPPSLIRTLRRCLQRDQHLRPTCEDLLRDTDPFLYPVELGDRAVPIDEELLGRIIQSVVTRCKDRMPSESELATVWPQAYWSSVRKATSGRM